MVVNVPVLASDGKALVVAMDHARTFGAIEGLEDPGAVIEAAVDGGADAVMTTFGVAKHYREQLTDRIPPSSAWTAALASTGRTGWPTRSGACCTRSRTPFCSGPIAWF
jgi:hypothetical protein